jgi:hypothetical protein
MTELINQQNKLVAMAISFYLRLLFFEQLYRDRNINFVMKSLVKGLESYYQKFCLSHVPKTFLRTHLLFQTRLSPRPVTATIRPQKQCFRYL